MPVDREEALIVVAQESVESRDSAAGAEDNILRGQAPPEFSRRWTVVCVLIIAGGLALMLAAFDSFSGIGQTDDPERALAHITGRTMELAAARPQGTSWERAMADVLDSHDETVAQLRAWYADLTAQTENPRSLLYAAVLDAESGDHEALETAIASWANAAGELSLFRQMLSVAYLEESATRLDIAWLQAQLTTTVPDNWFSQRVAARLEARASAVTGTTAAAADAVSTHHKAMLWRNRTALAIMLLGAVITVVSVAIVLWRRYRYGACVLTVSSAFLPPPWSASGGAAVLARGGAWSILLLVGLSGVLGILSSVGVTLHGGLLELSTVVFLYAPVPVLIYVYYLYPARLSLSRVFGFQMQRGGAVNLLLTVAVLYGLGTVGDWLIAMLGSAAGRAIHWTEWFNDQLVWGTTGDLVLLFVEVAICAPIFEEIIFRGVVYGSLRRRYGWPASAAMSAVVFSVVHGYGLIAFCAVGWSGLVWAWAYEKTGSLLPGMIAHSLNNTMFLVGLLVAFR